MNVRAIGCFAFADYATFIMSLMFDFGFELDDRFFFYLLAFMTFTAFLVFLVVIARSQKKEKAPRSTAQTSPKEKAQPESFTLNLSTKYNHSLTVADFKVAEKLIKRLNQKGVESTLHAVKGTLKLQFTAPQKLQNIDKLKKKGLIKEAEITEVWV